VTFQTVAFTGYWNFISCPIAVITATNVVYLDGFEYANIESWSLTYEPNPVVAVFDVGPVTLDLASGTHTAIVVFLRPKKNSHECNVAEGDIDVYV